MSRDSELTPPLPPRERDGGESGYLRMHLTCIRADERPQMEVRAGDERSRSGDAKDGMLIARAPSLCLSPARGERTLRQARVDPRT
ncbi:MAG: hypothetical protein A2W18_12535 [Candidatus Muproteobacteria bacterium RBG_16_60_9]|uniref:Uncharacterized protein n=1 Tax=Candidatus Muproteobacteria bacterium RBG_16_60_9 TaxID=1817755 RepID=A0A1F6VKS5_9PROT|nr:MAG: hypothetical protein A2W18_12535 [Candidatus Muproteobacteria bacterium RBG_16_60_9]